MDIYGTDITTATPAQLAELYWQARRDAEEHKWGGGSYDLYTRVMGRAWDALYALSPASAYLAKAAPIWPQAPKADPGNAPTLGGWPQVIADADGGPGLVAS